MAKKSKSPKKGKRLAGGKSLGRQKTMRASGGDLTITKPVDKPTPIL